MTAPSPDTHPAERETPAGEAMREAVAREMRDKLVPLMQVEIQKWMDWCGLADEPPEAWSGARNAWDAIASELARLTERLRTSNRERNEAIEASAAAHAAHVAAEEAADAAEAALTTLRADHAAEVARKDEEIARLRATLRPFARYAEHCPGIDSMNGEIGEYYHDGLRVSISLTSLRCTLSALANPEPSHD